ncbi:MAG: sulfatase family protein [Planctomycetota bacterium]|jgi:arylsulfatase A-like enzyme
MPEVAARDAVRHPNVLYLMCDQLAARALGLYGCGYVETPNIDRLAAEGVTFDSMIATCPVCTPFRSMWLTGRHPQTTGHLINFVRTRHDEIGWGDVFARAGYRTGYIGKWHLHTGSFPEIGGRDFVPEGRDRLGFEWWRGYNFHTDYFGGAVNLDDWRCENWKGYETEALNRYAFEFLDQHQGRGRDDPKDDRPFCLLVNPHQPHFTPYRYAPDRRYERLPEDLPLPRSWRGRDAAKDMKSWRDYLAMVLALDDMLGGLMDGLEERGLAGDTILVFGSDHGTHLGTHGEDFWGKKMPWEENVKVPMIVRWPGVLDGGRRTDALTAPVDLLPSFCGLCGIAAPSTVEGHDLSAAWRGEEGAFEQDAVFMMNFAAWYDYLDDGWEWRGVRTLTHTYARHLDGRVELFDNALDPAQERNLADDPSHAALRRDLEAALREFQGRRGDELRPASSYADWFDHDRRIIRNALGALPDPEDPPDWNVLT